jgi:hypothetical protein
MLRRLSADTAMIIGCALSWGVVLGIVIWLDGSFGLRAFAWCPGDIVPAGAFACGLLAGAGGFIGLALSRMRPTPFGAALPAIVGASIPISFYWLIWYFGPVGLGPAPSETIPLARFLADAFADPRHNPSAGAIALQFLGGLMGGVATSIAILWVDACPRCSELMSPAGQLHRYVDDFSRLTRMTAASLDEPAYVSMLAALEKRPTGLLWISAFLKICKHCGMGEIVERRRQNSKRGWGRPSVRRKYGARAPALVRWFMPPVNGTQQDDGSDETAARYGA